MGILRQDRLTTERCSPAPLPLGTGLGFDLFDERGDPLAVELLGKPTPAGQRIESENFGGRILHPVEVLAAAPGGIFLGAIEPETFEGHTGEQSIDRVGTGPVLRSVDETFFNAVGDRVALHPMKSWLVRPSG